MVHHNKKYAELNMHTAHNRIEKYKFKCFLKGKYLDKTLIVLPAFSPIMPGTEINKVPQSELLSPILRKVDHENFEVLIYEGKLYKFRLGDLR